MPLEVGGIQFKLKPGSYVEFLPCRIQFNYVRQKCDCRFISRTCVEFNSELILSGVSVSGKCFKRRVFNMADGDTEPDERI